MKFSKILVVFTCVLLVFSCQKEIQKPLIIYTYDSFTSEWGPGPKLKELFEKQTGAKIEFVSKGDAGVMVSLLLSEVANPVADLIIGIDQNLANKVLNSKALQSYKSKEIQNIQANLIFDSSNMLTPYDHAQFAIMFDTESKINPPKQLSDLLLPEYAKKLILMDPRTSTPGLGFFAWTLAVYGDDWQNYWTKLKPSILTIASGWDQGYSLFVKGEAPLVISYATSEAYHIIEEKSDRYQALVFSDGQTEQIECVSLVNTNKNSVLAKQFIDFLLTKEAQEIIAVTNWMLPVRKDIRLPEGFSKIKQAEKVLIPDQTKLMNALDIWSELF